MNNHISLSAYIIDWMDTFKSKTVKDSTYDRLLTSARALDDFPIAAMTIDEITCMDIQRYVNELASSGYALSTIKKQLHIVTAPLKQAAALHLIPANPAVGICLPAKCHIQKDERAVDAYSPEEQSALYSVLSSNTRKGYAVVILMIESGLRIGEALALRWQDVQLSRRRLNVHSTVVRLANKKQSFVQESPKSESSRRTVPLTPKAVMLLTALFVGHQSEWVFTDEYGDRLSYEAVRYQTQRACQEAKVEYRGMHVFRHTFATNCYHKKVDIKILSRLLGHSDTNITYNIYVHLYGDGFEEMYDAIAK